MSDRRTIVVTGGTGGLGTAVVERLVRDYRCVVLYNRPEGFETLRSSLGSPSALDGVRADLTDEASVVAAVGDVVAKQGGIYALVHLAGGFALGKIEESGSDVWQKMLSLNLLSAASTLRAVIPHLRAGSGGRIVAVASEVVATKPPGVAAYTVSKVALSTLIELAAKELNGTGITANVVAPGSLATPAMTGSGASGLIPLERVADTIAFLLGDGAANITGAIVPLRADA